jgi:hypothetical protein
MLKMRRTGTIGLLRKLDGTRGWRGREAEMAKRKTSPPKASQAALAKAIAPVVLGGLLGMPAQVRLASREQQIAPPRPPAMTIPPKGKRKGR